MRTRLASMLLCVGLVLGVSQSLAMPYAFTASGALDAAWTLDSDPTPDFAFGAGFVILDVPIDLGGSPVTTLLTFFVAGAGGTGGVCADALCALFDLYGPQLFSGPTSAPSFLVGTFTLGLGSATGPEVTLVIEPARSPVPEPGTLLLTLAAIAAARAARRKGVGHRR